MSRWSFGMMLIMLIGGCIQYEWVIYEYFVGFYLPVLFVGLLWKEKSLNTGLFDLM
jgi:hypothetical protein